jgi:NADH-quinone oxidoreductase subunit D
VDLAAKDPSLGRRTPKAEIEALVASKGGDWDGLLDDIEYADSEQIVLNMGPQHPSTHGVLRLILDIDGETVTKARAVIGYLHTGIEKSTEFRTFSQAVQFLTRADYLSPTFNETCYCLAVEKLLGIEVPQRATIMRVLLMEITRISSHLVAIATGGMETGALTGMTMGFREREEALHVMELITGLRMNQGFVRPGGVAQDMPLGWEERLDYFIGVMNKRLPEYDNLLTGQPIWKARLQGVGYLPVQGCLQLGVTGPPLRSSGLAWDLRKTMPY